MYVCISTNFDALLNLNHFERTRTVSMSIDTYNTLLLRYQIFIFKLLKFITLSPFSEILKCIIVVPFSTGFYELLLLLLLISVDFFFLVFI